MADNPPSRHRRLIQGLQGLQAYCTLLHWAGDLQLTRTNKDSDPSGLMHFEQRCDWGKGQGYSKHRRILSGCF